MVLLCGLHAWSHTLQGTVKDATTGEAVEFAIVELTPGQRTVVTDVQGHYRVNLEAGTYTLKVSFIGYKTNR